MPSRSHSACARQDRIDHLGSHRLGDNRACTLARIDRGPDDRSYKLFVERLARKPAAVEEGADKGRDHVGRIGARRYFALAHRSCDHRLKRRRVPHLNPAVNVSKCRIALGGIDNRRHDRRPSCGDQKLGEAGQESRHIALETAGIGYLLFCAYSRASVQDEIGSCCPVSIDGGLGDPGSASNLIDTDAAQSALGQEFERRPKHDLLRATHTIIERLGAAAVRALRSPVRIHQA